MLCQAVGSCFEGDAFRESEHLHLGGKADKTFWVGIGDESYFPHWSAGIWSLLACLKLLVSPENSAKDDGKNEFSFLVWIKLWKFAEKKMSEEFWNFLKQEICDDHVFQVQQTFFLLEWIQAAWFIDWTYAVAYVAGWFQVINGVAVLLESARGRSLVGMGLGHLTLERLLKLSCGVGREVFFNEGLQKYHKALLNIRVIIIIHSFLRKIQLFFDTSTTY